MDKSSRRVFIYGKLRTLIGRDYVDLTGDSVYELVEGLSANFKKELQPSPGRPKIVCKVRGFDTEESLHRRLENDELEIHIYPTLIGGGGNNALMRILIGIVVVVVAVVITVVSGGTLAAPAAGLIGQFGSALLVTGMGLIVGGLLELMMPQPKTDMSAANNIESSKYLGAQSNTIKIGTPIPILMGEHMAYGHIISFNVDATNVAA